MALITPTALNLLLDNLLFGFARADGDSTTWGVGESGDTYGTQKYIGDALTAILATADADVTGKLVTPINTAKTNTTANKMVQREFRGVLGALLSHFRTSGAGNYPTLNDGLTYLNTGTGTKWQALQHPRWRTLHYLFKGTYPSAWNVYFEVLQGATYANALRSLLVGTGQTTGFTSLDTSMYCGGFPYLKVSGFSGSSGLVTVTGDQYDPATQAVATGKTWTGTVAANGDVALASGGGTPASANALMTECTGISAAGSITAPTLIYVECRKPSGRLAVPD